MEAVVNLLLYTYFRTWVRDGWKLDSMIAI
jgi:hypothetical protein